MDREEPQIEYLKLKEFLKRNTCVNRRTFSRWKKQGLIDCLQPGGPNTQILVPEDALRRMEIRRSHIEKSDPVGDSALEADANTKRVRPPDWMKNT